MTDLTAMTGSTTTIGHNGSEKDFSKFLKDCEKFGAEGLKGEGSLFNFARRIVTAVNDGLMPGVVDTGKGKLKDDRMREVYDAYLRGRTGRTKDQTVVSSKQQISKARAFSKLAHYMGADAADLLDKVKDFHEGVVKSSDDGGAVEKAVKGGNLYECAINVARAQNARFDEGKAVPQAYPDDIVLTDDEIKAIMFPEKDKREKTPAEKVKALYEAANKLVEGREGSEKYEAIEGIDNENLSQARDLLKRAWFDLDPEAAEAEEAEANKAANDDAAFNSAVAALGVANLRKMLRSAQ